MTMKRDTEKEIEDLAGQRQPGLAAELLGFLKHNKKWWLIPILVVLAVFGLVLTLASTPIAPFIYTLF